MNVLQKFAAKELEKLRQGREWPKFSAGDTVKISVKVREGTRERIQVYEGVCIARHGGTGINASFTVRKISHGEGVERVFPLYSPRIDNIEIVRRGSVRRAKLYYLRTRRGKSARIAERVTGHDIEPRTPANKEVKTATPRKTKEASKTEESEKKKAAPKKEASKKATQKKAAAKKTSSKDKS